MGLMKLVRVGGAIAVSLFAMPMPASAQFSDWEECNLQCRRDYGNTYLYFMCRDECTRIYGPPPAAPPVGKLD